MGERYGGEVRMSGVHRRHYSPNSKVKQNRHLPVSFFHENEARELETAVGGTVGVNSIPNTPSYKNMKYTQI